MSNNKNVVNESAGKTDDEECARSQRPGKEITISIDSESEGELSEAEREQTPLLLPQQPHQHPGSMERERIASIAVEDDNTLMGQTSLQHRSERNAPSNLLSLFNNQLRQQRSSPGDTPMRQQTLSRLPSLSGRGSMGNITSTGDTAENVRNVRFWREAIRSFINHSSTIQYTSLANERSSHSEVTPSPPAIQNQVQNNRPSNIAGPALTPTSALRLSARSNVPRSISLRDGEPAQADTLNNTARFSAPTIFNIDNSNDEGGGSGVTRPRFIPLNETNITSGSGGSNSINTSDGADAQHNIDSDDINEFSELFIKFLSHFVRYLPFICILLVKFLHDHFLGILDVVILQFIVNHMSKNLRAQVTKLSQKSYIVLLRDFAIVLFVVSCRLLMSSESPDPLGMLIQPPSNEFIMELSPVPTQSSKIVEEASIMTPLPQSVNRGVNVNFNREFENQSQLYSVLNVKTSEGDAITKTISLGMLLYYVAVNDLVLKLLTVLVKLFVTLLPIRVIRHKARGRFYVLLEYLSQFYRSLAPIRQWLIFLFDSYSGLEVISGVLFSSFYLGAKGFELVERGKNLKKAFIKFIRNMDSERPPTKAELEAAGSHCPICHDAYTSPIALKCGHVFCDECVSTWFRREQTCPMCRAKVNDDPIYQDGFTTYFFQLF